MKECTIQLKDGDKTAEITISYENNNELVIIDGLFKFFNINIDYVGLAKKQVLINKMYESYYSDDRNYRTPSGSAEQAETNELIIREKPVSVVGENPGIRIKGGLTKYRCHYTCPSCKNTGNRYITEKTNFISCHECSSRMQVRAVNPDFTHDENYNYFVAGIQKEKED